MATKSINTRIKNRVDTLSAWLGDGVELLSGELAVVRVPTGETYTNPITKAAEPVTELLMKVGDGTSSFDQLPWLSAKASDVYNWAKVADPGTISIKYNDGTSASPSWQYITLTDFITDAVSSLRAVDAALTDKMKKSVSGSNTNAGVLKTASVGTDGGLVVTKSTVATADIADSAVTTAKIKNANVTTAKIADKNVTTAKIADSAVTNDKVGSDISATKIVYSGSGDTAVTVAAKIQNLDSAVTNIKAGFSIDPTSAGTGVVQGITYNSSTGKFSVTYGTVATGDIADSAVTTAKIADKNVTTAKIADKNVTTAKIADSAITNTQVSASADIAASKILYSGSGDSKVTVASKLQALDSAVSGMLGSISVNPATATSDGVVQGVTYDGAGKISVSYGTVATADLGSKVVTAAKIADKTITASQLADKTVTAAKIADSTITSAKISSVAASKVEVTPADSAAGTAAVMLPATLGTINSELVRIEGKLDTFTASGVRFLGTVSAAPSASSNDVSIGGTTTTAKIGDIVLNTTNNVEYICVATSGSKRWQELGDQSRLGTVETLTSALHSSAATPKNFVTYIKKDTDGKLKTVVAQPTATDVKYGTNSTVEAKLGSIDSALTTKVETTDARLSDARTPKAHNQASSTITAMTGYSKPSSTGAIGASDSLNTAIGKLEKALDGKGTSNLTLAGSGSASTAAKSDHTHTGYESQLTALEEAVDVTKVSTAISNAINALDVSAPTVPTSGTTTATAFIDTISQSNGKITATRKNLPTASTSAAGITKLYTSLGTSTDGTVTRKVVNDVNTKAVDAQNRVAAVEADYVRFDATDNKLYAPVGDDLLEIIFDCGGAAGHTAAAASYSMRMTTPAVSSGSDGVLEVPNGNAGDLTGVEINGETVDPSNYTVQ
jgi:hypothetical protein